MLGLGIFHPSLKSQHTHRIHCVNCYYAALDLPNVLCKRNFKELRVDFPTKGKLLFSSGLTTTNSIHYFISLYPIFSYLAVYFLFLIHPQNVTIPFKPQQSTIRSNSSIASFSPSNLPFSTIVPSSIIFFSSAFAFASSPEPEPAPASAS